MLYKNEQNKFLRDNSNRTHYSLDICRFPVRSFPRQLNSEIFLYYTILLWVREFINPTSSTLMPRFSFNSIFLYFLCYQPQASVSRLYWDFIIWTVSMLWLQTLHFRFFSFKSKLRFHVIRPSNNIRATRRLFRLWYHPTPPLTPLHQTCQLLLIALLPICRVHFHTRVFF